ncbi:MAG: TldD/PmbA family protein [Dehalococcoidia bacterium]|nr:MAG: TldD/PmbA family protein [Dehalococcoidia bacterium]
MEALLAKAKKVAEEAEVFIVSVEETPVRFEANRLKYIQSRQSTSVALRIVRQGRIGYATTTEPGDIQNLLNMAVETAQFGTPARFEFPPLTAYPRVEVFDPAVESVSIEAMIKLGEELIVTVSKHTPDIVCEAEVARAVTSVALINSRGSEAKYKESSFHLGVAGSLIRDTDMLFVGEKESSGHPITESKKITDAVIRQLELAQNKATLPSRSLPVVFTPRGVASALVPSLMAAFNGKTVLEGASPIGNRLGDKVFDERFCLVDDATLDYRPSSRPCDDEGVVSQRTPLVEQGVVTSFLYDLQTAALAKTQSTGNGSRSGGRLPSPAPNAFIISPGDTTFAEMVGDIKEGLVVEMLMGAEQGNVLGGDFSGNVLLGYKVESGKIVGRVKDTMVFGNVFRLLKNMAAIGSENRWVGSLLQTSPLYFPRLAVASKG